MIASTIATASSVLVRLSTYFFLRWALVPILAPFIFTLLAVNVPATISSLFTSEKTQTIEVVEKTVVVTKGRKRAAKSVVTIETPSSDDPSPAQLLRTLILGAPSGNKLLSILGIAFNVVLGLMVADRLYSEHSITAEDLSFVRLGYVSNSQARFLVREPNQTAMPLSLEIRIKNPEPPFDSPTWENAGGVRWTDEANDFTAVIDVQIRNPAQRLYEWKTSNNHSGEFWSAPKPGQTPLSNNGSFTFLATSCMVSRVPYTPLDHPLAIPGTRHLAKLIPTLSAQFMLFLGDFVYVDVPRYWGKTVSDYRQKYRQVYASPDWNGIAQNLSWIHVLDDHEISNDWDRSQTGIYKAAVDPYNIYHTSVNPPLAKRADSSTGGGQMRAARPGATYFEFQQGPASFFMMDTRSYRSSNSLPYGDVNKTMLGAEQAADLIEYLRKPEPRGIKWKIIATSVPFTKNWRVNRRDTWGGFLAERQELLEAMWDAGLRGTGVVILSGDRHEFAATKFPPPANSTRWPQGVAVHEFSASPLSQFFSPVRTYYQRDSEDVELKYINWGNSKFGAVTITPPSEGSDSDASRLQYRLYVDGKEAWDTEIESPETLIEPKSALSSIWGKIVG
ncbi:alkaline phosphatase family protein [Ophiostoma piceae UAMH 11346]|uniref:Alkaline phosphatase family protein n=1 Tax=Ophiostoma piceae (strain UAMH 11346) TaxID=1262450 RepID=S3BM63_OPHP1|nr:alkaline phosphatase family protein [Ophiostoma piceae UAMH 11346]